MDNQFLNWIKRPPEKVAFFKRVYDRCSDTIDSKKTDFFNIRFLPFTIIIGINKCETLHLLHAQNAYNFSEFIPAYHAGTQGK
jgi:hypothetical protein